MCLDKLTKLNVQNEGIGYKVLENFGEILRTPFFPMLTKFGLEMGANVTKCMSEIGEGYNAGFHIFTKLDDAKKYLSDEEICCVYEVSYRNVLAEGLQGGDPCITAEYMTVNRVVHVPDFFTEPSERSQDYKWEDRNNLNEYDFDWEESLDDDDDDDWYGEDDEDFDDLDDDDWEDDEDV